MTYATRARSSTVRFHDGEKVRAQQRGEWFKTYIFQFGYYIIQTSYRIWGECHSSAPTFQHLCLLCDLSRVLPFTSDYHKPNLEPLFSALLNLTYASAYVLLFWVTTGSVIHSNSQSEPVHQTAHEIRSKRLAFCRWSPLWPRARVCCSKRKFASICWSSIVKPFFYEWWFIRRLLSFRDMSDKGTITNKHVLWLYVRKHVQG